MSDRAPDDVSDGSSPRGPLRVLDGGSVGVSPSGQLWIDVWTDQRQAARKLVGEVDTVPQLTRAMAMYLVGYWSSVANEAIRLNVKSPDLVGVARLANQKEAKLAAARAHKAWRRDAAPLVPRVLRTAPGKALVDFDTTSALWKATSNLAVALDDAATRPTETAKTWRAAKKAAKRGLTLLGHGAMTLVLILGGLYVVARSLTR